MAECEDCWRGGATDQPCDHPSELEDRIAELLDCASEDEGVYSLAEMVVRMLEDGDYEDRDGCWHRFTQWRFRARSSSQC